MYKIVNQNIAIFAALMIFVNLTYASEDIFLCDFANKWEKPRL